MSSPSKNAQLKQASSPGKSKLGFYLSNTIYLLAIIGVLAFLYQSVMTFFFGN